MSICHNFLIERLGYIIDCPESEGFNIVNMPCLNFP